MFKFNIFEFYIFMLHKVLWSATPIDSKRFRTEFDEQNLASDTIANLGALSDQQNCKQDYVMRDEESSILIWALCNPLRTLGLIRKHHMVGNLALFLHICYLLLLTHLFVKSLVHTFITGSDREMVAYFESIYYPHLAGLSTEPNQVSF